jgi:hypothetical protein
LLEFTQVLHRPPMTLSKTHPAQSFSEAGFVGDLLAKRLN